MADTCQLCNAQTAKYKCPTCRVPYCSLICYKPHKIAHESEPSAVPAPTEAAANDLPPAPEPSADPRPAKQRIVEPTLSTPDLLTTTRALFAAHPNLKSTLRAIHAATQKPEGAEAFVSQGFGRGRGRGGYANASEARDWNENGNENGSGYSGRGRGRGYRGRGRGRGRGGGAESYRKPYGDKEAVKIIRRLDAEAETSANRGFKIWSLRVMSGRVDGERTGGDSDGE